MQMHIIESYTTIHNFLTQYHVCEIHPYYFACQLLILFNLFFMNIVQLVYHFTNDVHLAYLQFQGIITKVLKTILVYVFWWTQEFISIEYVAEIDMLSLRYKYVQAEQILLEIFQRLFTNMLFSGISRSASCPESSPYVI